MVRCGAAPWRQLAAADHLLRIIGCGGEGEWDSRVTRWQININISAASRLRPEHGLLSSPLPPDLSCCTPPRPRNLGTSGSGLETRLPPVRSGAGRCGLPEIWRLAVTYRAWQDRAGIVRSRKLQWAVGQGRARTVLLQRSAAGVQCADLAAGSRAARPQPSVTQSDASDSDPGPRLPGSRNTAGAGAGHGSWYSWQLAWKLSWQLTADCWLLLCSYQLSLDTGRGPATWHTETDCTGPLSPATIGLGLLIHKCVNVVLLAMSLWYDDGINMRKDTKEHNVRKTTETV